MVRLYRKAALMALWTIISAGLTLESPTFVTIDEAAAGSSSRPTTFSSAASTPSSKDEIALKLSKPPTRDSTATEVYRVPSQLSGTTTAIKTLPANEKIILPTRRDPDEYDHDSSKPGPILEGILNGTTLLSMESMIEPPKLGVVSLISTRQPSAIDFPDELIRKIPLVSPSAREYAPRQHPVTSGPSSDSLIPSAATELASTKVASIAWWPETIEARRVAVNLGLLAVNEFNREWFSAFPTTAKTTTATKIQLPPAKRGLASNGTQSPSIGQSARRGPGHNDREYAGKVIGLVEQWPVKHSAVVEGELVLGGLMMVHEREDSVTCGPVMPQGGIQALEAMLYTLDRLNGQEIVPGVNIGAHILDDCDKDTYGLEMAVDFIKGEYCSWRYFWWGCLCTCGLRFRAVVSSKGVFIAVCN